ncbi:MAG: hypothetical protein IIW61_01795, partial [Bacteroidaceae bacterium]|nr:hypothetical protein [Bacteroidaceae bacterium]
PQCLQNFLRALRKILQALRKNGEAFIDKLMFEWGQKLCDRGVGMAKPVFMVKDRERASWTRSLSEWFLPIG